MENTCPSVQAKKPLYDHNEGDLCLICGIKKRCEILWYYHGDDCGSPQSKDFENNSKGEPILIACDGYRKI